MIKLSAWFKEKFKVKIAEIVSMNPEDAKEAWYLNRRVYVDEDG